MFRSAVQGFSLGQRLALSLTTASSAPGWRWNSSKTFSFDLPEYKLYKLKDAPAAKAEVTKEEMLKYYSQMYLIRRVETAADGMYKSKLIRGFLHLYNGQEAVAVGSEAAITKDDHVITAYRDHGFQLLRGDKPERVFAELMGRATGCSKGMGGSMHMYLAEGNFHGGNGIVGAQVPIGAGLAFAEKYKGTKNVCLAFYGDGAANQGQLFEAYNMAALWHLPVVFICENNKYGMGTSIQRAAASIEFYERCPAIPGLWVSGMDVLAVKTAIQFAVERARAGLGPTMVEAETYRYVGHSMSDPGTTYRSREEIDKVRDSMDPIMKVKNRILANNIASEEQLKAIEKEVRAEVDEAVEFAKTSAWPPLDETYKDVYNKDIEVRGQERTTVHYLGKV